MKNYNFKKTSVIFIVFIFLLLIGIPIIKQGIMCNDELQLRLLRKTGIFEFLKTNFEISTSKGRL